MTLRLSDVVSFRGDRLFNGAVNMDWFGTDEERTHTAAGAFIFHGPEYHGVTQADVGIEHGHRLQDTAEFAHSIVRRCYGLEDQPFTLAIAGYGTGKSHLGLTLAALLSDPEGETAQVVLNGIEEADRGIGNEIRAALREAGQPCLVVALNGMQSFDLTTEVMRQIILQIKRCGLDTRPLDELRPRFSQAASLIRMANQDVIQELVAACDVEDIQVVLAGLDRQEERIYSQVHDLFASKGMPIAALRGESVRDVIDVTVREYCGTEKPYRTLLILFDEFGRYMEFATIRSPIAGSGVLQDLFESVQAHGNAACFTGFIQFELNTYVQRIASEYRNEILRYVTRYQSAHRVYLSINLETLIANLFEKRSPEILDRWFDNQEAKDESKEIGINLARWFPQVRNHRLWGDPQLFHTIIRKGCWPLSPYSTWFLFHLAAAGKHLQGRSALALLGDVVDRFKRHSMSDEGSWSLAPADFWSDALQQELINSEESGQQGSITNAYASVEARHGAQLTDELRRLLRAVVLASKMGLKASQRGDAVQALAELAGRDFQTADNGLRLLQEEYNVLDWDERFKEFDILGEAVPRTQFLSFVRQRVASTYDEAGKASLFASKSPAWCDLLGDMECDFAEESKITTREWRYQGVTSSLDLLPMHVKLASDRWAGAVGVDEPRGTIIYCYVEPSRDLDLLDAEIKKILRAAAREAGVSAIPILVVLLVDTEGVLGQALAELAVLDGSLSEEDRLRFGNLIPAHNEKNRQVVRTQIENMIKQRRYLAGFKEPLEAQRLNRVGTEIFSRIYKNPVPFPFDGFNTTRGNAADSCQGLTTELLLGKLDYDSVLSMPVMVRNRAITVLKESWGIFGNHGDVRKRPAHPLIKALTEKWDDQLNSEKRCLSISEVVNQLCRPPCGANLASAGLFLGVFIAPRLEKLVIVRNGQQVAVAQWLQDGVFRNRLIDMGRLHDVDLLLLGEESSEWEILLEEWEQAESYSARKNCLIRANDLKQRIPVPPALVFREQYFQEQGKAAVQAMEAMDKQQNKAIQKMEAGIEKGDVGLLSWGAAELYDLVARMTKEKPLWTDHQIAEMQPFLERARPAIIHYFPDWLADQSPRDDTLAAVGDFKNRMLHKIGGNLSKLGLDDLLQELQTWTGQMIRTVETAAEALQLIRDVRSWLTLHGDTARMVRIAEIRDLRDQGQNYTAKLRGMSQRIQMPELGEIRAQLSEALTRMKKTDEEIMKRAERLWKSKIRRKEDLESILDEVNALIAVFENCPTDLSDFQLMQHTLRMYQKHFDMLENEHLTWPEFEDLTNSLIQQAEDSLGEDTVPWPPQETIEKYAVAISKRRQEAGSSWIESVESEVARISSMSVTDASRLHTRVSAPPAVLTDQHAKRLAMMIPKIENRLNELKLEWLVEKFKDLSASLRKKFIQLITEMEL
ncbi:MAG: hypothetical protein ACE15F_21585 [bacterium]